MQKNTLLKYRFFANSYQYLLKPFFFLLDPEKVHLSMTTAGAFLGASPWSKFLIRICFQYKNPCLEKTVDGITFPNPVGLAAGFDYEAKLPHILPELGFGFMTVGTVTLHPYTGNPKPRLKRFPKSQSLLVNKGFKSLGAVAIIQKLARQQFSSPLGISIGSTNTFFSSQSEQIEDIKKTFRLFETSKVHHQFYELNISCPNTQGGQPFTTPSRLQQLLIEIDLLRISKPVYIKMPIDLGERETLQLLKVAEKHHIQGVIFGNLTKDKSNPDVQAEDLKQWQRYAGNLSGKPTWKRSNALIFMTKKHFKSRFTIIGTGGIFSPADAQKKLDLGADLVQLITGMIYQGPQLIGEINLHLAQRLSHN